MFHDNADPVGFAISDGTRTVGYRSDIGMLSRLTLTACVPVCQGLILECNHEISTCLRTAPTRPPSNNASAPKTATWPTPRPSNSSRASPPALQHVVLAHISESNNCHQQVHEVASEGLHVLGVNSLARQEGPGKVLDLG